MSVYKDYNDASTSYDSLRFAVGSDVIVGMIPYYCAKPLADLHILDAGCGTGNYTKALLQAGLGQVSMIDASRGMLEKARAKLSDQISSGRVVDIKEAKLPKLPYADSSFDAVVFSLVLHHLQTNTGENNFSAFEEALYEAKRVLNKNGVIAIATLFPDTFLHLAWYTRLSQSISNKFTNLFPTFDQLLKMLERSGLKLLSKLDHYKPVPSDIATTVTDPLGPTIKEWRDVYSYWACGTDEEITEVENKVKKMHDAGTLEDFVKEHNKMDYFFYLSFLFATPV